MYLVSSVCIDSEKRSKDQVCKLKCAMHLLSLNIRIMSQFRPSYLEPHGGAEFSSLAPKRQGSARVASCPLFTSCVCHCGWAFVSLVPGVLHHSASGKGSSSLVTGRSLDRNKSTEQFGMPLSSDKGLKHLEVRAELSPTKKGFVFHKLAPFLRQVLWNECDWEWSAQRPEPLTVRMSANAAGNKEWHSGKMPHSHAGLDCWKQLRSPNQSWLLCHIPFFVNLI